MSMLWVPYVAPPLLAPVPSGSSGDGPQVLGLAICGILLLIGIRTLLKDRKLRSEGVRVPGVVTGLDPSRTSKGSMVYHPVYSFTTAEGRQLQVRSPEGSNLPGVSPGDRVTVIYVTENPEEARIDTPSGRGALFGWLLVAVAVLFLILQLNPGALDAVPGFVMLFCFGALAVLLGVMAIRQAGRRRRQAQNTHELAGAVVTMMQVPSYFGGGVAILIGSIMTLAAVFMAF